MTETVFKNAVVSDLRSRNVSVTLLESRGTGIGQPDTFNVFPGGRVCVTEYKVCRRKNPDRLLLNVEGEVERFVKSLLGPRQLETLVGYAKKGVPAFIHIGFGELFDYDNGLVFQVSGRSKAGGLEGNFFRVRTVDQLLTFYINAVEDGETDWRRFYDRERKVF